MLWSLRLNKSQKGCDWGYIILLFKFCSQSLTQGLKIDNYGKYNLLTLFLICKWYYLVFLDDKGNKLYAPSHIAYITDII